MLLAHEENHVHLLGGYKQPYVLEMHLMEDSIFHVLHLSYCFLLIQLACFKIVLIYWRFTNIIHVQLSYE